MSGSVSGHSSLPQPSRSCLWLVPCVPWTPKRRGERKKGKRERGRRDSRDSSDRLNDKKRVFYLLPTSRWRS